MVITGITVSVSISDKQYGTGGERFAAIKAEEPDPTRGISLEQMGEVMTKVLDLTHHTYKAVQGARYAQGEIDADTLSKSLDRTESRYMKLKKFLESPEAE